MASLASDRALERPEALSEAEPEAATGVAEAESPVGSDRRLLAVVAVGALVAWGIDQATKIWAVARLDGHDPISVIPGLLSLRFLRNPGAAFGMGASMTAVLTLVAVGVVVAVVRLAPRLHDRVWAVALGLLLAGATGNLTDRLLRDPGPLRGHVVDFIDYNGWFVGNVADVYLTVAAGLILWRSWQNVGLDGKRAGDE
ncbi:MAG: signal peptidase II [Aeromicrobium sp.]|uniref:signal peptidase II n=1 Tax=Aeromicrobium sp. TaxID=1871063 RepID=UPI0039E6397E